MLSKSTAVRSIGLLLFTSLFFQTLFGQSIFREIPSQDVAETGIRYLNPIESKTLSLDAGSLEMLLSNAPLRFSTANAAAPRFDLPMPDGTLKSFLLYESPVMHADLQAKYPEIRCYTGVGIDDPTATLKCDWTPQGFHAMIFSGKHNTVAIDPVQTGDREHYFVYFKKHARRSNGNPTFECATEGQAPEKIDFERNTISLGNAESAGDCQFREYRLALACTAEYANFHGGTVPLVLAAMNTTMNRVNGVYEREASITMTIIANNDQLLFFNSGTDPYSNGSGGTMLGQNQNTVTNIIGAANYDIGHVFSTGGGGIAGLGVVCSNGDKARGVTGQGQPVGDFFDIDYVAHEMGHQFGANHTFYNSCGGNKNGSTAFEPGSGATIMAYAGICPPNVQNNSDDYFHGISLQEMGNYVSNSTGGTCPTTTQTGNNAPIVSAGQDRFIPINTPFALTADATDADNDPMTYCWEQWDASGQAAQPPQPTNTAGPLFRSLDPTDDPTRYFPPLMNVILGSNNTWERLPGVTRDMNFRVTVRDNHSGAGCTDEDNILLRSTAQAGPFVVNEPNSNVLWLVGETREILWDVANTDASPVSCSAVRILLSTDGGFTYPIVLADSVPNTGSAFVLVPDAVGNTNRVMVQAIDNYFYDISNFNFRIELPPVPTFLMNIPNTTATVCAGTSVDFDLNFTALLNFATDVQLSISGLPMGATGVFSNNPIEPDSNSVLTISGLTPAMAGQISATVTATAGAVVRTGTINLNVLPGAPMGATSAISPSAGTTGVSSKPTLSWDMVDFATSYEVEVASNPSFSANTIVTSAMVPTTSWTLINDLDLGKVYYWRVQPQNLCGTGFWAGGSFQIGGEDCGNLFASTAATNIPSTNTATVTNTISVTDSMTIEKLKIDLKIDHTYIGDLLASLTAPNGTEVELFDQPGMPAIDQFGCPQDDIEVTFDDEATNTADDFETECNNISPAISGTFQSIEPLSVFSGTDVAGDWTLTVSDVYDEDGGAIVSWSLDVCFPFSLSPAVLLNNNSLTVDFNGSEDLGTANLSAQLSGTAAESQFTLTSLPQHGVLFLNGVALGIGGVFTQADIDAGMVSYQHNGGMADIDNFVFDLFGTMDNGWLSGQVFEITILQNTISAQVAISQEINCANTATGSITVSAAGGNAPLTYSLNSSGIFQNSPTFSGLLAGNYSVLVRDAQGFTFRTDTIMLAQPSPISASVVVNLDTITVIASGGTGILLYSLDGGNTFTSNNTFTGLANGAYTVLIKDANGCEKTVTAIVAVNSLVTNLEIQEGISCANEADASLAVNVGGGQMPYTYSLNGGTPQNSNVFENLGAGSYSVLVTDNQGFMATTNVVNIVAPDPISVTATVDLNTITVQASGGSGTLQYSLDGMTFSNNNVFVGVGNGTYNVVVKDENDCFAFAAAMVDVLPLAIVNVEVVSPNCFGENNGTVTLSAVGGVPPYEYRFGASSFQIDSVFAGLTAGTYIARIRDAQGNVVTQNITVTEPAELMATSSVSGNDVAIFASGGTGVLTYAIQDSAAQNSAMFMDLANGGYTFVVTDENGCSASVAATVNLLPLSTSLNTTSVACFGDENGSIEVTVDGGLMPYSYSIGGISQNTPLFTGLPAGMYQIIVEDSEGQTDTLAATIEQPDSLSISAVVSGSTIVAVPNGGTAPFAFSLNQGATFQNTAVFLNTPNGTYDLLVRDANGCTATFEGIVVLVSSTVNVHDAWQISIQPNPSTGLFFLKTEQALERTLQGRVFDVTGREIQQLEFPKSAAPQAQSIDLQQFSEGVYFLQLSDGEQSAVLRLVKI